MDQQFGKFINKKAYLLNQIQTQRNFKVFESNFKT
jgi:hypothetical protein